MNPEDLTRPERFTERAQGKEKRTLINALRGCVVCVNRAGSAFGRGYCRASGRDFPSCQTSPGLQFQLDAPALDKIATEKLSP